MKYKQKEKKEKVPFKMLSKKALCAFLSVAVIASSAGLLTGCGKKGDPGAPGAPGADGKNGSAWYTGTQYDISQGVVGDFFYDTDDFKIYKKNEGGWYLISTIKSSVSIDVAGYWVIDGVTTEVKAKGENGEPAETPYIRNGNWWVGEEDLGIKATGEEGKSAYDLALEEGFEGNQAEWLASLKGEKGDSGKDGATWLTGTAITGTGTEIHITITNSKVGDLYFNTNTCDIYQCIAENTWKWISNIKGDTPTIEISDDGYWVINGEKTDVKATGGDNSEDIVAKSYKYEDVRKTLTNLEVIDNYTFNAKNTGYMAQSGRKALTAYIDQEILKGATSITFTAPEGLEYSRQLFNATWEDYKAVIPSSQTAFNDKEWQTETTTLDLTQYEGSVTFGMCFKTGLDLVDQVTITICYDYTTNIESFVTPTPTDTSDWITTTPQSMCTYEDKLFILYDGGGCAVMDLTTQTIVDCFKLPNASSDLHCSNVSFGKTIVDGTSYPALYVNKTLGDSECFVYSLHQTDNDLSATLIQTITFDDSAFGNPSGKNYRDFLVDDTGDYMYIIGYYDYQAADNYTIIKKVAMPSLTEETVALTEEDVLDSFDVQSCKVIQGVQIKNGLIFIGNDRGSKPLGVLVVDLTTHEEVDNISFVGYVSEVEGVAFYNGDLYIQSVNSTIYKATFSIEE